MYRPHTTGFTALAGLMVLAGVGCAPPQPGAEVTITPAPASPASAPVSPPIATRKARSMGSLFSGSQRVVEDYLKAARIADGAAMYALIAGSERESETPDSLRKTAADRYRSDTTWEILKTEEKGGASHVVVDFKSADVKPNPVKFTLTKEGGEWRIVDSPELHEREKDGRIRIKL